MVGFAKGLLLWFGYINIVPLKCVCYHKGKHKPILHAESV